MMRQSAVDDLVQHVTAEEGEVGEGGHEFVGQLGRFQRNFIRIHVQRYNLFWNIRSVRLLPLGACLIHR